MYKKKLGVRVVTAITVGSLLCSNASVAMAAEEVSSIIKEHSDESNQSSNSTEVTVLIHYFDKASGEKIGEGYEHVTVTEGEDPVVLNASDLENLTVDGVEYQVADTAEDCTVEYRENVSEVRWAVAMDKIEEPEINSKDVTVRINYYDKASGKKIGEDFEHVTVTEGEDPVVLKAADLGTFTVDGVEYQVADDAVDCTVEYRENVSEVYWAVSMDKIEEPEVNSKDVTVRINYYDKASGKKIGEAFEHVTVTEGEDPVVLKATDLGTFTVDGVEYQVADDAVDCTVEYRENVSEVYWAVSMNKIEKPEVNSKDVTVRINYYDKASGKKIGEAFEHVTVTEGEDPVVLKAADLDTFTVDGVEYQVADDAVDCTIEYRENVSEVYWAVSMNKIEKPQVNSKDVTVRINYYDKASGEKIGEAFEHVTVAEGEDPVVLKAADLGTFTVDGVEYQVADDAVDCTVEYRENVSEVYWAVSMDKIEQPEANTKDVTVRIWYYNRATGLSIGEGFKHVTVTEGADPVILKAVDLENLTVDGVEYKASSTTVDCTVEYHENVDEVRWAVAMDEVETHRDLMVNYVIDMNTPVLSETIQVEKGQEFLKLDSLNTPAGYVLGDNGGDSIYIEDLTSVYVFVKEKPFEPEETHRDLMVNYVIDMENPPVLSQSIKVEKNQEFLKLDSLNIPAGYVLGDNGGDSIYIEDLTSVYVFVKEKPFEPEETHRDLMINYVIDMENPPVLSQSIKVEKNQEFLKLDSLNIPAGYVLGDNGGDSIYIENFTSVYVFVKEKPFEPEETHRDLMVNYVIDMDTPVLSETIQVEKGQEFLKLDSLNIPAGYVLGDNGGDSIYIEDLTSVYVFVKEKPFEPEETHRDLMVNYVIDMDTPVLSETIQVEKGQEFLKLDSLNIPAGYVLGDNGGDSIYIEDLTSVYVFVKEKPFEPEETHRDLMVNYVIDMDTPVLSETIQVEKDQEFLKLDSLNIPAGYVLGDNGGDSIYIEDLTSVYVFVKEKPVEPEETHRDLMVNYIIDMDTPVLSETIRVEKDQEFLKLDSLNIPAGYVLGDNGGDSIYIADLDSVFVYVKEKSVVDPEVNSRGCHHSYSVLLTWHWCYSEEGR